MNMGGWTDGVAYHCTQNNEIEQYPAQDLFINSVFRDGLVGVSQASMALRNVVTNWCRQPVIAS